MNKKDVYEKIETILKEVRVPLAAHEFVRVFIAQPTESTSGGRIVDGRFYVGQSESAIARRLREMRELGRVTSQTREGKAFKEYSLVLRKAVQQDLNFGVIGTI